MTDWDNAIRNISILPPFVGNWYKHYKGCLYVIVGRSIMENTLEQLVTYSIKHAHEPHITRTCKNFFASIAIEGEPIVSRFTKIDLYFLGDE